MTFLTWRLLEQQAHAEIVHAGVVADDRQALDAAVHQRLDEILGNPAQAETARGDGHVVSQETLEGGRGARLDFGHLREVSGFMRLH